MRILTLLCAAAFAVCAQTNDTFNVRFATPVVVGETLMPAGDVSFQVQRGSSSTVTLLVRSSEGAVTNIVVTRFVDETSSSVYNPHVVLRRNGNTFYFDRLLLADRSGFQVLPSDE